MVHCFRFAASRALLLAAASANAGKLIDACGLADRALDGDDAARDKTVLTANDDDLYERSGDCTLAATGGKAKALAAQRPGRL